jgi:hypothetical protein
VPFQIVSQAGLRLRCVANNQSVVLPPGGYEAVEKGDWLIIIMNNQEIGLPIEIWRTFLASAGINCEQRTTYIMGLADEKIEFPELAW